MAMVSETMGVFDSRICIGEASDGDLGCPTYSPTISSTGRINASAGLTVNTVSLTHGDEWGYLGQHGQLPAEPDRCTGLVHRRFHHCRANR